MRSFWNHHQQTIFAKAIPIGIAFLAMALVKPLVGIFVTVTEPGNASVVFNSFSGIQKGRILLPGAHLISPGVERAISYDIRTRVWEFTSVPNSPRPAGAPITVITADGQSFAIDANITLRPNVAVLDALHGQVGEQYISTVVVPVVRSKIRDISAQFSSQNFYQRERRQEIAQKALALINREMPTTKLNDQEVPLIIVEGVFLESASFPPALKESIEKKQVASILAQTASVKAKIQEKETERILILAKSNERAIQLKGEAAAINASLADLLFFEKLEQRIEQSKDTAPFQVIRIEGNSTVFLNVDPKKVATINSK
ncbi:MAG: prohibitin family protein [Pseudanabaenaceae cyanobacterium bins.68]|nr:prohibitin family protein [Pseudanabaenaceae cyanobacterium bins.68]